MQDFVHQPYLELCPVSVAQGRMKGPVSSGLVFSVPRFLSSPFITMVPFFLIFSFNKLTVKYEG